MARDSRQERAEKRAERRREILESGSGYSPAEAKRDSVVEGIDESFDAFEEDLSRAEYGSAVRDFASDTAGAMSGDSASVGFSNQKRKASDAHRERSRRARASDESQRATLTTDFETWAADPDEYDFPGVDTPDDSDLDSLL